MSWNGKTTFATLAPLAIALALGLVLSAPAQALHRDGHGSQPNGDGSTTLSGLQCGKGQIAKSNGEGGWHCAEDVDSDSDSLADLSCAEGEVAKFSGGAWSCAADQDTDADTLADIICDPGDFARLDPTSETWECLGLAELREALADLPFFVFVTSSSYTGDLVSEASDISQFDPAYEGSDGLEAGDFICNALADDAGLPGNFVAWLSAAGVDARDRLTPGSGPFRSINGDLVASGIDDLTDFVVGSTVDLLSSSINYDENDNIGNVGVWTGTSEEGMALGSTCEGWTTQQDLGYFGWSNSVDSNWTWALANTPPALLCSVNFALYCFAK